MSQNRPKTGVWVLEISLICLYIEFNLCKIVHKTIVFCKYVLALLIFCNFIILMTIPSIQDKAYVTSFF